MGWVSEVKPQVENPLSPWNKKPTRLFTWTCLPVRLFLESAPPKTGWRHDGFPPPQKKKTHPFGSIHAPRPHMSRNQNLVQKWSTQNHAKNSEGGCNYFWLGSSLTNLHPGFEFGSPVRLPSPPKKTKIAQPSWLRQEAGVAPRRPAAGDPASRSRW